MGLDIKIQNSVGDAAVEMYDRYVAVTVETKGIERRIMSHDDFFNHLVVRGMLAYSDQLTRLEQSNDHKTE